MSTSFESFLNTSRDTINQGLEELVDGLTDTVFQPHIKRSLLSGGKRLRPILVLLSSHMFGGDQKQVMPLAISHELIHTASLVHDDIIDQAQYRRGRRSVPEKWGVEEAILTGDALLSIAIELSSDYPPEVIKSVSRMAFLLSSGEKMEFTARLRNYTQKRYLDSVRKKTGAMFVSCVSCPAQLQNGSSKDISNIEQFGRNLGILFQIRDDINDISTDNSSIPRDFCPPRITLPVIHAYQNTDEARKQVFLNSWQRLKKSGSNSAYETLKDFLAEKNSIIYCKKLQYFYAKKAARNLSFLPPNSFRSYLRKLLSTLEEKEADLDGKILFQKAQDMDN